MDVLITVLDRVSTSGARRVDWYNHQNDHFGSENGLNMKMDVLITVLDRVKTMTIALTHQLLSSITTSSQSWLNPSRWNIIRAIHLNFRVKYNYRPSIE